MENIDLSAARLVFWGLVRVRVFKVIKIKTGRKWKTDGCCKVVLFSFNCLDGWMDEAEL